MAVRQVEHFFERELEPRAERERGESNGASLSSLWRGIRDGRSRSMLVGAVSESTRIDHASSAPVVNSRAY